MNLKSLSDSALLAKTDNLVQQERAVLTEVLRHLREIEVRRLYSILKYNSLFAYAVKHLKYSDDQAGRRIAAMRLIKEIPQVEEKLEQGALSLATACMAQTLFNQESTTPEEKRDVIANLEGKSKKEAEKVIAIKRKKPKPRIRDRIRATGENTIEVKFEADSGLEDKLARLKSKFAGPDGKISLGELVDKLADQVLAEKPEPRPGPLPRAKNGVAAAIRRLVIQRAKGRCELCGSFHKTEVDHIVPRALGGSHEPENLRLLCRNCNQRAAIEKLGIKKMRPYLEGGRLTPK